jgi:hypothetical protein
MKIGVIGCSHSSYGYGNPWHHYIKEKYNNVSVEYLATAGSGNEYNIEKIKYILDKNEDIRHFIIQLTEPSRLDIGMDNMDYEYRDLIIRSLKDIPHITLRMNDFDNSLKNYVSKEYKIYDFFKNHVLMSNYNQNYKIFHTIMSITQLCSFYNVNPIFFSWFVDLKKIANNTNYSKILEKINMLDGYVFDHITKNNIKEIPGNGHYNSEAHKRIFEEYINPQLIKYNING